MELIWEAVTSTDALQKRWNFWTPFFIVCFEMVSLLPDTVVCLRQFLDSELCRAHKFHKYAFISIQLCWALFFFFILIGWLDSISYSCGCWSCWLLKTSYVLQNAGKWKLWEWSRCWFLHLRLGVWRREPELYCKPSHFCRSHQPCWQRRLDCSPYSGIKRLQGLFPSNSFHIVLLLRYDDWLLVLGGFGFVAWLALHLLSCGCLYLLPQSLQIFHTTGLPSVPASSLVWKIAI